MNLRNGGEGRELPGRRSVLPPILTMLSSEDSISFMCDF